MTSRFAPATRGIFCMTLGTIVLSSQDAITKYISETHHIGEIIVYRSIWSLLFVMALAWHEGGARALRAKRPKANVIRALIAFFGALLVVSSFQLLPLADATAVIFASPLIVTALSVPLLGEPVTWQRWAAVIAGFVGIVIITDPGGGIAWIALLPLAAAVMSAARDLYTRWLGAHDSSTVILFYTMAVATLGGALSLALFGTTWPTLAMWSLFAISGFLAAIAHWLMIRALQLAPAASVSPFRYTALLWAAVLGFLVWDHVPAPPVVFGAGLVVASGLYLLRREQLERRLNRP